MRKRSKWGKLGAPGTKKRKAFDRKYKKMQKEIVVMKKARKRVSKRVKARIIV